MVVDVKVYCGRTVDLTLDNIYVCCNCMLFKFCQISPLQVLYDLKVKQMSNYISKTKT